MRVTHPWARPRTTVLALAFAACLARGAEAAPIRTLHYQTVGAVGQGGVTGYNVVGFEGVQDGSLSAPGYAHVIGGSQSSAVGLGAFVVDGLPGKLTTTYSHTPFAITFLPTSIDGDPTATLTPVTINGEINGQVQGGKPDLTASFQPPANGTFAGGDVQGQLTLSAISGPLAPGGTGLAVQVALGPGSSTEFATPEPTTTAILLVGLAGLGLVRRGRRRKA